ncbi:MAG: hypothetical protein HKN87_15705 [Saprospiraceae bacterium]|nr:hypothetical protein [Saprospiraceae bacterium]
MPRGVYEIGGVEVVKTAHWSLALVMRFNHHHGIAPYNGTVAVVHNSQILDEYARKKRRFTI